jgi:hypothetical protein
VRRRLGLQLLVIRRAAGPVLDQHLERAPVPLEVAFDLVRPDEELAVDLARVELVLVQVLREDGRLPVLSAAHVQEDRDEHEDEERVGAERASLLGLVRRGELGFGHVGSIGGRRLRLGLSSRAAP